LFDLDYLTDTMNYQPVTADNKANKTVGPKEANNSAGIQDSFDVGIFEMEAEHAQEYFVLPLWSSYTSTVKSSEAKNGDEKPNGDTSSKTNKEPVDREDQELLEIAVLTILEDIYEVPSDGIFTSTSYDDEGAVADFTNLESIVNIEPKKISQALEDESWVDAMQEELLQFKTQNVWILVDLPFRKKIIGIKWVYRNKKDKRGVVVRTKARLVAQEHRQEEGIDIIRFLLLWLRLKPSGSFWPLPLIWDS
nr:copia protein [Tanacetum cinerariifolium]